MTTNSKELSLIAGISWTGKVITTKRGYTFRVSTYFPAGFMNLKLDAIKVCKFYQCTFCQHIYVSKSSLESHDCKTQPKEASFDANQTKKDLFNAIAVCNISFNAITNNAFQKFINDFNRDFKIPSASTLRRDFIQYSYEVLKENLNELRGKIVSIMIDGAKRLNINFEGSIIFTKRRLYYYPFSTLTKNTADNISNSVSNIIHDLNNHDIHVISVCSDNASVNIAAFNKQHQNAVQYKIGEGLVRIPCNCHLAESAFGDVFDKEFPSLFPSINQLLSDHPPGLQAKKLTKTRWDSIYKGIKFITNHQDHYKKCKLSHLFNTIETIHHWDILLDISYIMWSFVYQMECDHSSLSDVFHYLYITLKQLDNFATESVFAVKLIEALHRRFTTTERMGLPCVAYLITDEGKHMYQTITDENIKKQVFSLSTYGLRTYVTERELPKWEDIIKGFHLYLATETDFHSFTNTEDFWKYQLENQIPDSPEQLFSKVAYEISNIPCSEAPVERFFSHLVSILSPQRHNLSPELIQAISIVKMNYLFAQEIPKNTPFELLPDSLAKAAGALQKTRKEKKYSQIRNHMVKYQIPL